MFGIKNKDPQIRGTSEPLRWLGGTPDLGKDKSLPPQKSIFRFREVKFFGKSGNAELSKTKTNNTSNQ